MFNGVSASVTFATSNELTAIVPITSTTGKIKVMNANGSADSLQDFVPLRRLIPNNPPQNLSFDSSNKSYVFRFSGLSGQNISLLFSQVAPALQVNVVSPTGRAVIIGGTYSPTNNKIFFDRILLSETGDYDVEITSTNVGNINFSVYQFNDVSGDIPTDETPLDIAILRPGQNAVLNLNVSQTSQPTFLNISNATALPYLVLVKSPAGVNLSVDNVDTPNKIVRLENLPGAGIYTVSFNPFADSTGSASFTYTSNAPSEITVDGPALALTILPNQSTEITLTENAGQRVFINLNTGPFPSVNVRIFKPNGEILSDDLTAASNSGIDINGLPQTGTYRIVINPQSTSGGEIVISATSTASVGGNCPSSSNKICFVKEIFAGSTQSTDLELEVLEGGVINDLAETRVGKTKAEINSLVPIIYEFSMSQVTVSGSVAVYDTDNILVTSFNISEATESISFDNPGLYRVTITPNAGQIGSFKFDLRNTSFVPPPESLTERKSKNDKRGLKSKRKSSSRKRTK